MSEQDDAYEDLSSAGAITGILWAGASAYDRVAEDYDPTTGHDQGWVGYTAYKLLMDRLDRVFSCGSFELADDADAGAGQDVLALGITQQQFAEMPAILPGVVVRADLNGSPGWRCGDWRWLLNSFIYGESDQIAWAVRSYTKRTVASIPEPDALTIFSDAELGIDVSLSEGEEEIPTRTLILAHSMDGETAARELYIGRSRYNAEFHTGWYWKLDLLTGSSGPDGGNGLPIDPVGPTDLSPNAVKDAPVRLRRQSADVGEQQEAAGE